MANLAMNVKGDLRPLQRAAKLTKRQTVFATANTMTKTAGKVERYEAIQVGRDLDRPTPFTRRAFRAFRATPRRLRAGVFIKDRQFRYLMLQIYGGVQRWTRRRPTPQQIRTNVYGNIPRNKLRATLARDDVYSAGPRRQFVFQRTRGGRGRLLATFIDRARYRKRFRFFEHAQRIVRANLVRDWNSAVRNELRRIAARSNG